MGLRGSNPTRAFKLFALCALSVEQYVLYSAKSGGPQDLSSFVDYAFFGWFCAFSEDLLTTCQQKTVATKFAFRDQMRERKSIDGRQMRDLENSK
jgi:hypothetical protein